MNYLAHHALAYHLNPDADPLFYAGNLLPDLLALYGVAKLRAVHLPPMASQESPLLAGIRLHFATDVRFHSSPAFAGACAEASTLLSAAPFAKPLHRVFFLAHILVEIALDGHLLREEPTLASDLHKRLATVDRTRLNVELNALLPELAADLSGIMDRFISEGWVGTYAAFDLQAEALYRICRRGGLSAFTDEKDRIVLTNILTDFAPRIATFAPELMEIHST